MCLTRHKWQFLMCEKIWTPVTYELSKARARWATDGGVIAGNHPAFAGTSNWPGVPAGQIGDRLRVHVRLLGRIVLKKIIRFETFDINRKADFGLSHL